MTALESLFSYLAMGEGMVQNNGYRGAGGKSFCPAASGVARWGRGVPLLFLQPSKAAARRLPSGMLNRAVSAATTPFTRQHTQSQFTTRHAGSVGRRPPSAQGFGEEAQRPHPAAPPPRPAGRRQPAPAVPTTPAGQSSRRVAPRAESSPSATDRPPRARARAPGLSRPPSPQ